MNTLMLAVNPYAPPVTTPPPNRLGRRIAVLQTLIWPS
jgi:hypothetical protein